MQETMKAGTILIREGAVLPETLKFESVSYAPGWRSVQDFDGYTLDRKIRETGWHFFYFAAENSVTAFGQEGQGTVRKAIMQILSRLKFEKSNSIEITRVTFKTFWGVPYTSVSFHLRNMQESMFLFGAGTAQSGQDAPVIAA